MTTLIIVAASTAMAGYFAGAWNREKRISNADRQILLDTIDRLAEDSPGPVRPVLRSIDGGR